MATLPDAGKSNDAVTHTGAPAETHIGKPASGLTTEPGVAQKRAR